MDSRAEIDSLLVESNRLKESNPARGLDLAQQARKRACEPADLAACLLASGICRDNMADFPAALADLTQALELYRELKISSGEAAALDELGVCWGLQGENEKALELHMASLALWQKINDLDGLSLSLNHLGVRYYYFAQYDIALQYFQRSLTLREAVGDLDGMAHSYNNLAIIYDKFDDFERAVEYYQKSLHIFEKLESPYELANTLTNLAEMLEAGMHQPEEARAAFLRALALVQGSNKLLEALCRHGLGNLERGLENHCQAQEHYRAALALLRETGVNEHMSEVLVDLGRSQLAQPNPAGALESLREALELAKLSQANETIFLAHQWLAEACEQMGDYAAALRHFKEFHRVREAVYSAQTELKVKGLLLKAEADKARQETEIARQQAEIYRLKHEELSRAHHDLQVALEQNKRLLHDLQLRTEDLLRQVWEDALTGIHNRRYLEMRLPEECERARRFGHDLSVVLMDIDDFKAINDQLSHLIGDQVLKAVAHILDSVSRSVDLVVRYGGDEFMLAMIEADPQQAAQVCGRLREAVEQYHWSAIHPRLSVTLSMGLVTLRSLPADSDLIACADEKLYEAKRGGKNRIAGVN